MYEPLAKNDVDRLRAAGFAPTDEEVVRLNELAAALARGKDTTAVNHPRFAFAGNVVLHEPTIGALEWWWAYGRDAAVVPRHQLLIYCFMLAHARDLDTLNALQLPKDIQRAAKTWYRHVAASEGELLRALLYVRHGANLGLVDEERREADADEQMDRACQLVALAAGQSGIKPADLRTETESTLMAMVAASSKAGNPIKPSTAKFYMAYQQTIRAIEARGKNNVNE